MERLARLSGVHDFEEWKRQLVGSEARLAEYLAGGAIEAWRMCLPVWKELGRANDLTCAVRVPKYWPSFATLLARNYAERYVDDYGHVISVFGSTDIESCEYLVAYDVLRFMVEESQSDNSDVSSAAFSLSHPLPPVIKLELGLLMDDASVSKMTIGEALRQAYGMELGYVPED